jgi:hypothetical protein
MHQANIFQSQLMHVIILDSLLADSRLNQILVMLS